MDGITMEPLRVSSCSGGFMPGAAGRLSYLRKAGRQRDSPVPPDLRQHKEFEQLHDRSS